MNQTLRVFIEKAVTSLIPWFFIVFLTVFVIGESYMLSLMMAILGFFIALLIKRQIIKNKQRHAISDLVIFFEFSSDNTKISFDKTGEWCSGLMEINNVKFFCMVNVDDRLLRIKLPTLYRKKLLSINKSLVLLVEKRKDEGRVLIEIGPHKKGIIIPWMESFTLNTLLK